MENKLMEKADYYTYRISWSDEDKEYVGLCAEFPGLSWLDKAFEGTSKGIRDLVAGIITDMESNNEIIPQPLSLQKYSGKFMVRIPPNVHRELAIQAAEAKVSLNRVVSAKLAVR
jgi:predicted RNase H-like HicB family nuclease